MPRWQRWIEGAKAQTPVCLFFRSFAWGGMWVGGVVLTKEIFKEQLHPPPPPALRAWHAKERKKEKQGRTRPLRGARKQPNTHMKGKLIPIPEENLGAVTAALEHKLVYLREWWAQAERRGEKTTKEALQEDIAALTWAKDNIAERPLTEIGDGH